MSNLRKRLQEEYNVFADSNNNYGNYSDYTRAIADYGAGEVKAAEDRRLKYMSDDEITSYFGGAVDKAVNLRNESQKYKAVLDEYDRKYAGDAPSVKNKAFQTQYGFSYDELQDNLTSNIAYLDNVIAALEQEAGFRRDSGLKNQRDYAIAAMSDDELSAIRRDAALDNGLGFYDESGYNPNKYAAYGVTPENATEYLDYAYMNRKFYPTVQNMSRDEIQTLYNKLTQNLERYDEATSFNGTFIRGDGATRAGEAKRAIDNMTEEYGITFNNARQIQSILKAMLDEDNETLQQARAVGANDPVISVFGGGILNAIGNTAGSIDKFAAKILGTPSTAGTGLNRLADIGGAVQRGATEGMKTEFGKSASTVWNSIANSVGNILVGSALGGVGGLNEASTEALTLASFFGSTQNQVYNDSIAKGYSEEDAMALSTIAGAVEVVTEKVSLDNIIDMANGSEMKDMLYNIVRQSVTEMSEEGASEIANIISEAIILGRAEGWSDEDIKGSIAELAARVVESAGSGAVSGAVFGAGGTAIGSISNFISETKSNVAKKKAQGATYDEIRTEYQKAFAQIDGQITSELQAISEVLKDLDTNDEAQMRTAAQALSRLAEWEQQLNALEADTDPAASGLYYQYFNNTYNAVEYFKEGFQSVLENYDQQNMGKTQTKAPDETVKTDVERLASPVERVSTPARSTEAPKAPSPYNARISGNTIAQVAADNNADLLGKFADGLGLGSEGKKGLTSLYSGQNAKMTTSEYAAAYTAYYNAGKNGLDKTSVKTKGVLDAYTRDYAYNTGVLDNINSLSTKANNLTKETEENGRNISVYAGGERNDGKGSALKTRSVERSAEKADAGKRKVALQTLNYAKDKEVKNVEYDDKPVTAKSEGIKSGDGSSRVYLVTGNETVAMASKRSEAEKRGYKVKYFVGGNMSVGGVKVNGLVSSDNGVIYARADDVNITPEQIVEHELVHDRIEKGEIDLTAEVKRVKEVAGADAFTQILDAYAQAYGGERLSDAEMFEEIVCDAYAGINIFEPKGITENVELFGKIKDVIRTPAGQITERAENAPPIEKKARDKKTELTPEEKLIAEEYKLAKKTGDVYRTAALYDGNTPYFGSGIILFNASAETVKDFAKQNNVEIKNVNVHLDKARGTVVTSGARTGAGHNGKSINYIHVDSKVPRFVKVNNTLGINNNIFKFINKPGYHLEYNPDDSFFTVFDKSNNPIAAFLPITAPLGVVWDALTPIETKINLTTAAAVTKKAEVPNTVEKEAKTATVKEKTAKPAKAAKVEKTEEIKDFGQKIGGAKKDLWRSRGLTISDLEEMNAAERSKYIKKDNVWTKVDYQTYVDNGATKEVAYYIKTLRDALPVSPQFKYKETENPGTVAEREKDYIEFVRMVRDAVSTIKTREDAAGLFNKLFVETGYYNPTANSGSKWTEKARNNIQITSKFIEAVRKANSVYSWEYDVVKKMNKAQFLVAEDQKIPAGFSVELYDGNGWSKGNEWKVGTYYITKGYSIVAVNFETKEAAISWLKEKVASAKTGGKKRFTPPQLDFVRRTGRDVRSGNTVNIAGDEYINTFGFRGGEFGNWLNQQDRQFSLNYGYDALTDLADVLNIEYSDISFGGKLAIAFGARGQGAAAAHYEPERAVINLTKMKGAGSLAHEWAHALDDIIGTRLLGGKKGNFTENATKLNIPVVSKLIDDMKWKAGTEEQSNKAKEAAINRYRENLKSWIVYEFQSLINQNKLTDEQKTKYESLKESLISGKTDYHGFTGGDIAALSALKKEVSGHVIEKKNIENMSILAGLLYSEVHRESSGIRVKTDFYRQSQLIGDLYGKEMGAGYWDSNVEMFARAFACYVKDKLDARQMQSDYLNAHSESAVAITFENDDISKPVLVEAFPKGEERKVLDADFDALFAYLKENGYLAENKSRITSYSNVSYQEGEAKLSRATFEESNDPVVREFAEAVRGNSRATDEVKETYDFSKSFGEQIDDFKDGKFPPYDTFVMGRTPEVFTEIGLLPLPLTYTQQHAREALENKDGDHLGEDLLKQVPKALETPVAIIDSETVKGRIVAILDLKEGSKSVIAAVEIEGTGTMHRETIDSNAVVSAHSRENAIYKLLKNAIQSEMSSHRGIYYWNKKRAIQMARIHGVQFPGISTTTDGYVHSITDFSENVNRFSKNIFKTKQFKRWFGNSIALVKNSDGTPRAFYHGSVEDFDTFDKSRIRADDYDAPFNGFWFSSDENTSPAFQNAKYVKAYYLSVRNPAPASVWKQVVKDVRKDGNIRNGARSEGDEVRYRLQDMGYDAVVWDAPKTITEENIREYKETGETTVESVRGNLYDLRYDPEIDGGREYYHNSNDEVYPFGAIEDYIADNNAEEITVVVFEPAQAKSATDNIGTFDRGNRNTLYSIATDGDEFSRALNTEEVNGTLRGVVDIGKAKIATKADVAATAAELKRFYGAKVATEDLSDVLGDVFDAIAYGDGTDSEGYLDYVRATADEVSAMLIDNAELPYDASERDGAIEDATNQIIRLALDAEFAHLGKLYTEEIAKARQKVKEARSKIRQQVIEIKNRQIGKIREKNAERMAEYKQKVAEQKLKAREKRDASALRGKIGEHVAELQHKIEHNTINNHIPEKFREVTINLLKAINGESEYVYEYTPEGEIKRVKRTEASQPGAEETRKTKNERERQKTLEALSDLLDAKKGEGEALAAQGFITTHLTGRGENDIGLLDRMKDLNGKPLYDMTVEELSVVYDTIRGLEAAIKSYNKTFSAFRGEKISTIAGNLYWDNNGKKAPKLDGKARKDMLGELTPQTFFHTYGRGGDKIWLALRSSQDKFTLFIEKALNDTQTKLKELGLTQKDVRDLEKKKHKVKFGDKEVELTTAELIDLYLSYRREGTAKTEHLTKGGFEYQHKINLGVTKVKEQRVVVSPGNPKDNPFSETDYARAFAKLTDKERVFAEWMSDYLSTTVADWGNAATMEVYGFKRFQDVNYWRFDVSKETTVEKGESSPGVVLTPAGAGFTKEIKKGAANRLVLGNAVEKFTDHIRQMANYAAWLPVTEDMLRIKNYKLVDYNNKTVKDILVDVHGRSALAYWNDLMSDISNGQAKDDYGTFLNLVGAFKVAAVGANLRVFVQQPTAIWRASWVIPTRNLIATKPASFVQAKAAWDRAKKYSPIALWKSWGYYDVTTGKTVSELLFGSDAYETVKQKLLEPAGWADAYGWGWLWLATEKTVADKYAKAHPDKNDAFYTSDEFYSEVKIKFEECVDKTQVVDGVLQRNGLMRSKRDLVKMATAFGGEPAKIVNMAYQAAYDKNGKNLARCSFALLISMAINAAVQSLIDALRDDDIDEKYGEKYLEALVGDYEGAEGIWDTAAAFLDSNLGDAVNPLAYIPFLKDVVSIMRGYSVDRMDMEIISDIVAAMQRAESGKYNYRTAWIDVAANVAKIFGLPVTNIIRDGKAIAGTIINESNNYAAQYFYDKTFYNIGYSTNRKRFFDNAYAAYKNNPEQFEIIYDDMIKEDAFKNDDTGTTTADAIANAIESRMKDEEGVNSVYKLSKRFLAPEAQREYDTFAEVIADGDATEEQKAPLYDELFTVKRKDTQTGKDKARNIETFISYGYTEEEYWRVRAIIARYDKPTKDAKTGEYTVYGGYVRDELGNGISKATKDNEERALMWYSVKHKYGESERLTGIEDNPWRRYLPDELIP